MEAQEGIPGLASTSKESKLHPEGSGTPCPGPEPQCDGDSVILLGGKSLCIILACQISV
jgi:hypothetical protein